MNKKLMISADEVAEALGVSMSHAYKIVRLLNKDLEAKGFITVAGRVLYVTYCKNDIAWTFKSLQMRIKICKI